MLAFAAFGIQALQAQGMEDVEILSQQLSTNIWMIEGAGGNMILVKGDEKRGALLIDDQFAPLSQRILKTVKDLTGQQVAFVINTHWHGDHTGGNLNIGQTGAVIVAHQNVRERMSSDQFSEAFQRKIPASPPAALPVITFNEEIDFYWAGEEIHIIHVPNAHTDGDALVWFKSSNVLHVGDTWFNGLFPYIDVSSGGSSAGVLAANKKALSIADENTRIVMGHGPLGNSKELVLFGEKLKKIRARMQDLINAELTLDQIIEADPIKDFEEGFGGGFLSKKQFIEILYSDLTQNEK